MQGAAGGENAFCGHAQKDFHGDDVAGAGALRKDVKKMVRTPRLDRDQCGGSEDNPEAP